MLLTRLVSLVSGSARGRRLLWRGWYQFLAARYRDPRWTFMNYGYRSPDVPAPALDPADEPDRSFIQLYDVVARGAPLAGRELLEVGCGRGGGAAYVARALGPRRVVAVDLSPRAIALCRRRFHQPNLSFDVGDAEALPFPDGAFDAILNRPPRKHPQRCPSPRRNRLPGVRADGGIGASVPALLDGREVPWAP